MGETIAREGRSREQEAGQGEASSFVLSWEHNQKFSVVHGSVSLATILPWAKVVLCSQGDTVRPSVRLVLSLPPHTSVTMIPAGPSNPMEEPVRRHSYSQLSPNFSSPPPLPASLSLFLDHLFCESMLQVEKLGLHR